jgi:hypothetical protein
LPELVDQIVERSKLKIVFRAARPRRRRGVSDGKRHFANHLVHQAKHLTSARRDPGVNCET